jgi:hypothetical protein
MSASEASRLQIKLESVYKKKKYTVDDGVTVRVRGVPVPKDEFYGPAMLIVSLWSIKFCNESQNFAERDARTKNACQTNVFHSFELSTHSSCTKK